MRTADLCEIACLIQNMLNQLSWLSQHSKNNIATIKKKMKIESLQLNPISADLESDRASVKKLFTQIEIQSWIVNNVAELLEEKPDRIDITIPFDRYGLDSITAYKLTGDLETWLGHELSPTLMYNYPTIESLTQQLIEELKVKV